MVENIIVRDLTTGGTLKLSQDTTPNFILKEVDWGVIESTHNQTRYVKQIGTTLISTVLGIRNVELSGWVIGKTTEQMAVRKAILNSFFTPLHDYQIEYLESYKLGVVFNATIRYSREYKLNNDTVCEWKLEGIATDPLFYEIDSIGKSSTDSIPMFRFPFVPNENAENNLTFGEVRLNSIIEINNAGQVDIGLEIHIYAYDTVVNPQIINAVTGEYIKINKTLQYDEEVYINTSIGNKFVKGRIGEDAEYENYYNYRDFGSSWIQLLTGASRNHFVVTADDGYENMNAQISFNRAYLEVQQCE
jgi:hypothetical protein